MRGLLLYFSALLFAFTTCATGEIKKEQAGSTDFNSYWYNGEAELSSYSIEQARYGELHKGDAVLIFVTEDFWRKKQVKKESDQLNKEDESTSVLKLNYLKKFKTGIYDYSLMSSVFQPVDISEKMTPLKISGSVQDWCGQVFYQFNAKKNNLEYQSRSYFEKEGDENKTLDAAFLEDQIWNIIRIDPSKLPIGKTMMIPSGFYCRLMHKDVKAYEANTSIIPNHPEAGFSTYMISFPELERTVEFNFDSSFPYLIESWSEKYKSGWGSKRNELTTTAKRVNTIRSAYWEKNSNEHLPLRKELFNQLSP